MNAREVALLFRRSSIPLFLLCGVRKTRISDCVSPALTFYNLISLLEHPAGFGMIQNVVPFQLLHKMYSSGCEGIVQDGASIKGSETELQKHRVAKVERGC